MASLRELQQAMWQHITRAESGPLYDRLSADQREGLDLHREDYFERIHRLLRNAFPRTLGLLGDDQFHGLVADFLKQALLVSPSIQDVPDAFATFVPRFVPDEQQLVATLAAELASSE